MNTLETKQFNDNADAFGPVALTSFATNPTGAHLFRAQHERILRVLDGILPQVEAARDDSESGGALVARQALTVASSLLVAHQSFEESLVRRALNSDPRARPIIEQFEREMALLAADFSAFLRRYPSASSIIRSPGEFIPTFSSLLAKLQERFRAEERELFTAYDRAVCAAAPGGAVFSAE